MGHICPVCGYPELTEAIYDAYAKGPSYEICPSCSFEFGVTDRDKGFTYSQWRKEWIAGGMVWDRVSHRSAPTGWNPVEQLANAAHVEGGGYEGRSVILKS